MLKVKTLLFSCVLFVLAANAGAATTDELASENAILKKRIENMERELSSIKDMLNKPQPAKTETTQLTEDDLKKISKMVKADDKKKGVWANLDMQFYGYFKADASYDDSRVNTGNFVKWVESENSRKNDDQFNMTAKQTRLGLIVRGPEDGDMVTSGLAEIDFFGSTGAENKGNVLLRHAYLKLDWPKDRFSILAGQTWDVISPLNPTTLNYSVAWWAGNIGYRHPQIRLTKGFDLGNNVDLKLEGAISRTIGNSSTLNGIATESGADSGTPTLQGRVSLAFPTVANKKTTVGVSGHYGREEYDITLGGSSEKFESWSLNLDLTQPITEKLTLQGELFTGANLDDYLGTIGQNVNTVTTKPVFYEDIRSTGGWAALSWKPYDKWKFNSGYTIEDVKSSDVNAGDRTLNRSIFANAIYSINENADWGLELSQWHTERKGERDADDLRIQTSFIYKF